ncbi:MAG: HAMP domain-containing histidine kinase [Verrucomicrobia bacterium]|nr:HAMP domain-containing histidine kinase [Verrucomicrobiota bacterium]
MIPSNDKMKLPVRLVLVLAAAIFVSEFIIMVALGWWELPPAAEALVDASLLLLMVAPVLYLAVFRPMARDVALRQTTEYLEQRVRERTAELQRAIQELHSEITERKTVEDALLEARNELARTNLALENIVQDRTAELRKSLDELEHFSYSITHDMRAPLRAMRSYASLLLQGNRGHLTGDEKEWLQNIATSADRMDLLIVDALDYAKATRETLPLSAVDADALVRGILRSYPAFHSAVAKINVEGTLPPVLGNRTGLAQCFSNLLNNAVKFVPPGQMPQVRVRAVPMGARVRFWVEDKGIGIAREHHDHIFEMFHRLSEDYEGTGIGLALVKKVAEKMNGRVGVESEPGQGSRFWLDLEAAPVARQEAA